MSERLVEALVLSERGRAPAVEQVRILDPGPGEVRVSMRVAGLCHTDVSAVRDARQVPAVLGHEGAGLVEAVGAGVDEALLGTRVMLCWRPPCGRCASCRRGRVHHCEQPLTTAAPRVLRGDEPLWPLLGTGCLAGACVVPASAAIAVPDAVSDRAAALVGCAVATGVGAALWTAAVEPGQSVAVWGGGAVGQHVVVGAVLAGAAPIVCVDPVAERRADAAGHGATATATPDAAAGVVAEATGGRGVDVAFDVVGRPRTIEAALTALAPGGELVLVGAAARDATVSFRPRGFMSRQQRITGCIYGSVRPQEHFPQLLEWCATGVLDPEALIGEEIALADVPARFLAAGDGTRTMVRLS